jgi:hypothetical protein
VGGGGVAIGCGCERKRGGSFVVAAGETRRPNSATTINYAALQQAHSVISIEYKV